MRFASAPALTLESCIQDEVRAATGFDADGQGLITAEVDGQLIEVLGTLRPEDRAAGIRVRSGDRLRVEDVDSRRNRWTVAYVGPEVDGGIYARVDHGRCRYRRGSGLAPV